MLKGVSVVIKAGFYGCFCLHLLVGGYNLTHRPDGQRAPYRLHLRDLYAWVAWIQSQAGTPNHDWLEEATHTEPSGNPLVSHVQRLMSSIWAIRAWYQSISCLQLRDPFATEGDDLWVQEIARWEWKTTGSFTPHGTWLPSFSVWFYILQHLISHYPVIYPLYSFVYGH